QESELRAAEQGNPRRSDARGVRGDAGETQTARKHHEDRENRTGGSVERQDTGRGSGPESAARKTGHDREGYPGAHGSDQTLPQPHGDCDDRRADQRAGGTETPARRPRRETKGGGI